MLLGQLYGGMAMSTGYALHEELQMQDGRILNTNFDHYRIPRSTDLPEMTGMIIENSDPLSPSGAKGIGEPANELLAPAIANAIYHATGRRFLSTPIRVEALS
jgi:CO/xanthine dehydrogenase Mo-binding subunit